MMDTSIYEVNLRSIILTLFCLYLVLCDVYALAIQCGETPIKPNVNGFIVGGVEARPNSLPWQVGFGDIDSVGFGGQSCGGAIVSKDTVITAAHCITNPATEHFVVVGQHEKYNYKDNDKFYKNVKLRQIIMHPQWNPQQMYYNDIAILKLAEDIEYNDGVQPICLPNADQTYEETMFVVSGWGYMGDDHGWAENLQQVVVPYISQEICQKFFGRTVIHEKIICAGYVEGGKDSCSGDSGGPLATVINKKWTLAGVVSWGIGCAEKSSPGVYTHVAKYIDFINQHM